MSGSPIATDGPITRVTSITSCAGFGFATSIHHWTTCRRLILRRQTVHMPFSNDTSWSVNGSKFYDCLEFIVENWSGGNTRELAAGLNSVLEKQLCAFRFLGDKITPITDEYELAAIDEAATSSPDAARRHLARAVELLSDRHSPDYRNSVKEAVSAIEALCQKVTGEPKGTLGKL